MKRFTTALLVCALTLTGGIALADMYTGIALVDTDTWDGEVSNTWTEGDNWADDSAPGEADTAIINDNVSVTPFRMPKLYADDKITYLYMSNGASDDTVALNLNDKKLEVVTTFTVGDNSSQAESYVEFKNSSTADAGPGELAVGSSFVIEGPATGGNPDKTTTLLVTPGQNGVTIVTTTVTDCP